MRYFSSLLDSSRSVRPMGVAGIENLEVVPYVHNRLVFAGLAAEFIRSGDYQQILVDLPSFMNDPRWLEHPLGLLPSVTVAIFQRTDGGFRGIPFSPCDAGCIALYLARDAGVPFCCLDDSDMLNYPEDSSFSPNFNLADDCFVLQFGLDGYFEQIWEQLEGPWSKALKTQRFFLRYRTARLLERLQDALQSGRRSLLLCDYQLWWLLQDMITEKARKDVRYLFRWQETPGMLRIEGSRTAWAYGLLDDYPAVTLAFWNHIKQGAKGSFHKARTFDRLLTEALTGQGLKTDGPTMDVSVRRLINFSRYLKNLTLLHQRIIPDPGAQLFFAAKACGGSALVSRLAENLLGYPEALDSCQISFLLRNSTVVFTDDLPFSVPYLDEITSLHTGRSFSLRYQNTDSLFERIADDGMSATGGRKLSLPVEDQRILDELSDFEGSRWTIKIDYRLHAQACQRVRHQLQGQARRPVAKRCNGRIEKGVHWRRTLASIAGGQEEIYINAVEPQHTKSRRLDTFTTAVFLFASEEEINRSRPFVVYDPNEAERNRALQNHEFPFDLYPEPDQVFSLFGTVKAMASFLHGHVRQEDLTSLSLLYTGEIKGSERYHAITRRPSTYHCRQNPLSDRDLKSFSLSEKGIAWAVKYGSKYVTVAAPSGWKPSAKLQTFARSKAVALLTVPLSIFRPEFVKRLTRMYFISTALTKHPERGQIIRHYVL